MEVTTIGWRNMEGTAPESCRCGSWQQHWINIAKRTWPDTCSVDGCTNTPTLGAHVINPEISGEVIIPMCDSCNLLTSEFNIKGGIALVNANRAKTCESS